MTVPRSFFISNALTRITLKQMTAASMRAVKPHRAADSKPLHARAQAALPPHPKRKVIALEISRRFLEIGRLAMINLGKLVPG